MSGRKEHWIGARRTDSSTVNQCDECNPPVALITGGRGDLARATAHELEGQGWQVLAPGRDQLEVTDPASVKAYFEPIERLDYLICAAGLTRDAPLASLNETDWDAVIATNLGGARSCLRAAWSLLCASHGSIALIGSHAGRSGTAGQSAYAAAKAALEGLMLAGASEGGPYGIRANLVLPGFLKTKMSAKLSQKRVNEIRGRHLLGQFNSPQSAARFLAFLPTLPATSGQVFALDSRPI